MSKTKLMLGDNIESLKKLPENSVDSIVSDPPYGLSFMGKKWDYDVPSVEFWKEVYRVLKPGGHVLSFGGTRTYHRMVVNIEDAGFEIRDQIMWLYGSGFPKSHNIGKAVDKLEGNDREVVGDNPNHRKTAGLLELGFQDGKESSTLTKGQSQWEGWGTALKPANEPICVARKPLSEKSVAENVLRWGTGGINIDGCRVGTELISHGTSKADIRGGSLDGSISGSRPRLQVEEHITEGRFPANIILDEIAGELLDQQSGIIKGGKNMEPFMNEAHNDIKMNSSKVINRKGYEDKGGASRFFYQAKVSKAERNMGLEPVEVFSGRPRREDGSVIYKETDPEEWKEAMSKLPRKDKTALAGSEEKLQTQSTSVKNTHPTVKPVSLMAYLCRLVTPANGIVLDPFMGSGSTGIAARLEGFKFCGMEMDKDYFKIAESRIENFEEYRKFIK
jgi:site-specific DNA-methyltransferase (adenine-specific)